MDPPLPQEILNQIYANDSWYIGKLPRFERILDEPRIMLSVLVYAIVFQLLAYLTRCFLWNEASGFRLFLVTSLLFEQFAPSHLTKKFRQYRLRNITICFVHSSFCGLLVSYLAVTRFHYMINNPVFYNEKWMDQILLLSVGYFIHDAIDMLKYEFSRWTLELLVHHIVTASVLMIAVISDFFISFACSSLLMECNR